MVADPHAGDPLLRLDPARPFRWLFLDLNSYFASVEQQEDPALRGRPVGVVPSPGEHTCTIAASIEAKRFGIRTGTPVREARRLCPDIVLRQARHGLYIDYHHRILAEVDRHVPISRVWSIDEMSARLLGPQREAAAALDLARRIKDGLARRVGLCLRCSIGLAPSRQLAKLATELEKPDGLVALGPAELPSRLLHLAPRDIPGIGRRMAARLADSGVTDVAGLWALGPKRARQIWNSVEGERFWYELRGADIPEPAVKPLPHSISHARVLPPDLRSPDGARHVARLLAMKATARLRANGCLATLLVLEAMSAHGEALPAGPFHGEARMCQTDDERVVLTELDRILRGLGALPRRVRHVSVVLAGLVPAGGATPDLFTAGIESDGRSRLAQAVDSVQRRFGRASLFYGPPPRDREAHAGEKIAFSRVPWESRP